MVLENSCLLVVGDERICEELLQGSEKEVHEDDEIPVGWFINESHASTGTILVRKCGEAFHSGNGARIDCHMMMDYLRCLW